MDGTVKSKWDEAEWWGYRMRQGGSSGRVSGRDGGHGEGQVG